MSYTPFVPKAAVLSGVTGGTRTHRSRGHNPVRLAIPPRPRLRGLHIRCWSGRLGSNQPLQFFTLPLNRLSYSPLLLVPGVGVEPTCLSTAGFEAAASSTFATRAGFCWCPGRASNPHSLRYRPLMPACLPIPPPGHCATWWVPGVTLPSAVFPHVSGHPFYRRGAGKEPSNELASASKSRCVLAASCATY